MVLNPRGRGRGRGRGGRGSFLNKSRRGGILSESGPLFRTGPTGMYGAPPMGYAPEPRYGPPFFGGPSRFNYSPRGAGFGRFQRKNFKRKPIQKSEAPVPDVDLTKPWVTEEIKQEEAKKKELLDAWRKSKSDDDWVKYKAQKMTTQSLYDGAKEQYLAAHPEEAGMWRNETSLRKYFCETCDKSFRTDDDLYLHEAEHETCGRDGCEFTAHPKVVAKHIKMQHDTGLYKRIGKLYTDEDIAKWIEERKKRYPSRKVIEEKKCLELAKQNRGERIKEDDSKFNKSFQNRNKKEKLFEKKSLKNAKSKRSRKKKKNSNLYDKEEEEENVIESERSGVPAFAGIRQCFEPEEPEEQADNLDISDEEWENNKTQNPSKPLLNNSLGLLASCYDSDEDFVENDFQKENKTAEVSEDEGSGPEEVKTVKCSKPFSEDNKEEKRFSKKRKLENKKVSKENNKKVRSDTESSTKRRELTLLEKLLKNEIRHERNVILQCIHYIVKNNFFNS